MNNEVTHKAVRDYLDKPLGYEADLNLDGRKWEKIGEIKLPTE